MKEINVLERAADILEGVKKGALVTSKSGGKVNTMAISWGAVGIEWNKAVFITFLREGRFTRKLLEENPEFTVNIATDPERAKTMAQAGRSSGREGDKIAALGLTLVDGQAVSVPAIKEFPVTLECRIVSRSPQRAETYTEYGKSYHETFYPQDVPSTSYGANKDFHVIYVAEIVKAYELE